MPIRKGSNQRFCPFTDAGLTGVDFLPTAYNADNDRPISHAVQARDQKLWLGLIKARPSLLSLHEARSLSAIPRTLCFVEQRDVLDRRPRRVHQALIAKMVNVLDEHL